MSAQVCNQTIERLHRPAQTPLKSCKRLSPAKGPLNRTKRNLFGKVEPKALERYVKSELSRETEQKTKQYNFDFSAGLPLDGPLKWERVGGHAPVAMITLTQAAHVRPADELMDEQAERANRHNDSVDSHDDSFSSSTSSLSPAPTMSPAPEEEETEESVQTYPIPPPKRISPRNQSPKPSTSASKDSKPLRQPEITEYMKERKRRPSSTVETVSTKKGRMLSSESGTASGLQQQQEASSSK